MRREAFVVASVLLSACPSASNTPVVQPRPVSSAPAVSASAIASSAVETRPLPPLSRATNPAFVAALGTSSFHADGDTSALALSSDGARLAVAGDRQIRVFDTASGAELLHFGDGFAPSKLVFAAGSRLLASLSDNSRTVRVFDLVARSLVFERTQAKVLGYPSFAISADGKTLALDDEPQIRLYDVATGVERSTLPSFTGDFSDLSFSNDGKLLFSARAGLLRAIDVATGEVRWKAPTSPVPAIAVDPTGRWIAHVLYQDVAVVETASGAVVQTSKTPGPQWARFVSFSTDGKHLAVSGDKETARVFEVGSGKTFPVMVAEGVGPMVFASTGGDAVFTARRSGPRKHAKKGDLFEELASAEHVGPVRALAPTTDGKTLLSCGDDGRVIAWDVATRKGTLITAVPTGVVRSIAVSRDGRFVAAGGRLHDEATRKLVAAGKGELSDASVRGLITVWDRTTLTRLFEKTNVAYDTLWSLEFSADGKQLVGATDRAVFAWSVPSGAEAWKRELPKVDLRSRPRVFEGGASLLLAEDRKERRTITKVSAKSGAASWVLDDVADSFSTSAERAAYGAANRCVIVSLANGKAVGRSVGESKSNLGIVALSPDGVRCAFGEDLLSLFEVGGSGRTLARDLGGRIEALTFVGPLIATGATNGIVLWNP